MSNSLFFQMRFYAAKPKWRPLSKEFPTQREGESDSEFSQRVRDYFKLEREQQVSEQWQKQGQYEDRERMVPQQPGALLRGLSRLAAVTPVRQGVGGQHEFLLCRSLDNERGAHSRTAVDEPALLVRREMRFYSDQRSSWSAIDVNWTRCLNEAKRYREMAIQAWIPRDFIISIPKMYGRVDLRSYRENVLPEGKNEFAEMFEVVVAPAPSEGFKVELIEDKYWEPEYVEQEELAFWYK